MQPFNEFATTTEDGAACFDAHRAGETVAATMAGLFARRGDAFEVNFLRGSKHTIEQVYNWLDNPVGYRWTIQAEPAMYLRYLRVKDATTNPDYQFESIEDRISALGGQLLVDTEIVVMPALVSDDERIGWRLMVDALASEFAPPQLRLPTTVIAGLDDDEIPW